MELGPGILGAAVVAIITAFGGLLKLVLNALRDQREEFTRFLGNHMSQYTRTVEANTRATEKLVDRIEEMQRRMPY